MERVGFFSATPPSSVYLSCSVFFPLRIENECLLENVFSFSSVHSAIPTLSSVVVGLLFLAPLLRSPAGSVPLLEFLCLRSAFFPGVPASLCSRLCAPGDVFSLSWKKDLSEILLPFSDFFFFLPFCVSYLRGFGNSSQST